MAQTLVSAAPRLISAFSALAITPEEGRDEHRPRRQECPMQHSFRESVGGADPGRTPWSARDALVPPVREESIGCDHRGADQGVGCGRGRPPHDLCNCPETGKLCGIGERRARSPGQANRRPPFCCRSRECGAPGATSLPETARTARCPCLFQSELPPDRDGTRAPRPAR